MKCATDWVARAVITMCDRATIKSYVIQFVRNASLRRRIKRRGLAARGNTAAWQVAGWRAPDARTSRLNEIDAGGFAVSTMDSAWTSRSVGQDAKGPQATGVRVI